MNIFHIYPLLLCNYVLVLKSVFKKLTSVVSVLLTMSNRLDDTLTTWSQYVRKVQENTSACCGAAVITVDGNKCKHLPAMLALLHGRWGGGLERIDGSHCVGRRAQLALWSIEGHVTRSTDRKWWHRNLILSRTRRVVDLIQQSVQNRVVSPGHQQSGHLTACPGWLCWRLS